MTEQSVMWEKKYIPYVRTLQHYITVFVLNPLSEAWDKYCKTGFGQVKIMKELVWINRIFFLNLAFWQVGEKN